MSPQAQAIHDLLDHIDKLKAVHRASESPTFGQVEQLFDYAETVRRTFALPERTAPARWPTSNQTEKAARRLVELVLASLTEKGGAA